MLNETKVLNYVKSNLGHPFVQIELTDEQILEYIQEFTLKQFSYYCPELKRFALNVDLDAYKVPGRSNEFYIVDDDGLEILNVKDVYPPDTNYLIHGMRPMGPLSYGEIPDWLLQNEVAMTTKMFSSFDTTYEFIHPNMVRLSPVVNNGGIFTIEYERMQNPDFSGINNEYQWTFFELSLADIMIVIGQIRMKYSGGSMRTPFGEIPINSDIYNEGKEKKREILEKLNLGPVLNCTFSKG